MDSISRSELRSAVNSTSPPMVTMSANSSSSSSTATSSSTVGGSSVTSGGVDGSSTSSSSSNRSMEGDFRSLLGLNASSVNRTSEMIFFLSESLEINLNESGNFNYNRSNVTIGSNGSLTGDLLENLTAKTDSASIPWWETVPYPQSGYSQLSIILLAFLITCIMILIVIGNLLVCIAISTEKSLKTIQNWFITSLAVSDLLLGLVIVPFSLAHELMGYWIFGSLWCDIHHALDVLLTTASINNLCLISLDRYWSVTQAVEYLKKRTPKRAMYMIIFVWVFSGVVSLPPLVGWRNTDVKDGECQLSEDIGYVLYSAFGSFYVPAVVMVFVYAKIFVAARSRARKHVKKKHLHVPTEVTNDPTNNKSTTTTTCTSLSNPSPPDFNKEESCADSMNVERSSTPNTPNIPAPPKVTFCFNDQSDRGSNQGEAKGADTGSYASPTTLSPPEIVIEASESPQPSPKHHGKASKCDKRKHLAEDKCSTITTTTTTATSKSSPTSKQFPRLTVSLNECGSACPSPSILKQNGSANAAGTNETRFISVDDDSDTVDSPVTKTDGGASLAPDSKSYLSAPRLSKSPYGSTLSIADFDESEGGTDESGSQKKKKKGKVKYDTPTSSIGRHTPSDAERHKRKVAKARERRATLILGLIMGSFIAAWAPFFVMYLLQGLCKECDFITYRTIGYWLGYSNSAVNPIIYTVFNRDFRKAFRKILFR